MPWRPKIYFLFSFVWKWTPVCLPFREHCMSYPCNVQLYFLMTGIKKHRFELDSSRFSMLLETWYPKFHIFYTHGAHFFFQEEHHWAHYIFLYETWIFNFIYCLYVKSGREKARIHSFAIDNCLGTPTIYRPALRLYGRLGGGGEDVKSGKMATAV